MGQSQAKKQEAACNAATIDHGVGTSLCGAIVTYMALQWLLLPALGCRLFTVNSWY